MLTSNREAEGSMDWPFSKAELATLGCGTHFTEKC